MVLNSSTKKCDQTITTPTVADEKNLILSNFEDEMASCCDDSKSIEIDDDNSVVKADTMTQTPDDTQTSHKDSNDKTETTKSVRTTNMSPTSKSEQHSSTTNASSPSPSCFHDIDIPDEHDVRFKVLSYEQVNRLNNLMSEQVSIHGRGNFPTIDVKLSDLVLCVKRKLENDAGIKVKEIRLNGSGASSVLAADFKTNRDDIRYNDLDLIFSVDLSSSHIYENIKSAVLDSLMVLLPEGVSRERMSSCSLKDAYVSKLVKVHDNDRWSLIALGNNRNMSVELKFVDTMKRQYQFSVDSFHILLDTLFIFYDCAQMSITEAFYPTVIGQSMYGDFMQALDHLNKKFIATKKPEEIRGGGLLKYCNLLCNGYKPHSPAKIKSMERYMCSRFFIDFPDVNQQYTKLENYLYNHFQSCEETSKYKYLDILHRVVNESTVCLMDYERLVTLILIENMAKSFTAAAALLGPFSSSTSNSAHHNSMHHHQNIRDNHHYSSSNSKFGSYKQQNNNRNRYHNNNSFYKSYSHQSNSNQVRGHGIGNGATTTTSTLHPSNSNSSNRQRHQSYNSSSMSSPGSDSSIHSSPPPSSSSSTYGENENQSRDPGAMAQTHPKSYVPNFTKSISSKGGFTNGYGGKGRNPNNRTTNNNKSLQNSNSIGCSNRGGGGSSKMKELTSSMSYLMMSGGNETVLNPSLISTGSDDYSGATLTSSSASVIYNASVKPPLATTIVAQTSDTSVSSVAQTSPYQIIAPTSNVSTIPQHKQQQMMSQTSSTGSNLVSSSSSHHNYQFSNPSNSGMGGTWNHPIIDTTSSNNSIYYNESSAYPSSSPYLAANQPQQSGNSQVMTPPTYYVIAGNGSGGRVSNVAAAQTAPVMETSSSMVNWVQQQQHLQQGTVAPGSLVPVLHLVQQPNAVVAPQPTTYYLPAPGATEVCHCGCVKHCSSGSSSSSQSGGVMLPTTVFCEPILGQSSSDMSQQNMVAMMPSPDGSGSMIMGNWVLCPTAVDPTSAPLPQTSFSSQVNSANAPQFYQHPTQMFASTATVDPTAQLSSLTHQQHMIAVSAQT